MGDLLAGMIRDEFGLEVPFLHGGSSPNQREEMIRRFHEDPTCPVFLLSIKAAGTGLNLTAANHVIHYDLWWNPAVENQATDRAYRIGQERTVFVHRLVTENTFEDRIDALIQSKRDLAELSVGSGEQFLGRMTDGELRELVGL
jgi:SNF2 family DNA or RNA helicase